MRWPDLRARQHDGADQSEARIRILSAEEPHPEHTGDEPNDTQNILAVNLEFQRPEELE